jgi:sugar lactone lactonase YvrE
VGGLETGEEIVMLRQTKSIGPLALRLLAVLLLLGRPRIGGAAGTWSVISLPQKAGEVIGPKALAADTAGNLYVADGWAFNSWIQERDAQGNWSVLATRGTAPGQVDFSQDAALAVDAAGNLYVADGAGNGLRIQRRDAQGNWSVLAAHGTDLGQVYYPTALAADAAGNLCVAEGYPNSRIQKRDAQGNWSVIATGGQAPGRVNSPAALAVDPAGDLYVADYGDDGQGNYGRIQKRDARGNWSVLAARGSALGQVFFPSGLAVDAAGNLYVADGAGNGRIHKRDGQGHWSVVATYGYTLGQVFFPSGLAADATGSLYVADQGHGIQRRDGPGHWSLVVTTGFGLGGVDGPLAVAADTAGNLYVADSRRIQERDAQGNWSVVATQGVSALAVDTAGNLYVAEYGRIRKRDVQGNWSVIATEGAAPGQVSEPRALAVDEWANLYVADWDASGNGNGRIRQRDAQGNWSVVPAPNASALAADTAGNLYVGYGGIQAWDAQGNWSVIATAGTDRGRSMGEVSNVTSLAVDATGSLYVADNPYDSDTGTFTSRIQAWDAQGNWSVVATSGSALGQVNFSGAGFSAGGSGLAVDTAGNLYVTDAGNNRVMMYTPAP